MTTNCEVSSTTALLKEKLVLTLGTFWVHARKKILQAGASIKQEDNGSQCMPSKTSSQPSIFSQLSYFYNELHDENKK